MIIDWIKCISDKGAFSVGEKERKEEYRQLEGLKVKIKEKHMKLRMLGKNINRLVNDD